jgi:hypothetical protein
VVVVMVPTVMGETVKNTLVVVVVVVILEVQKIKVPETVVLVSSS